MIFEKPSLRTRVTFEVGIQEHGRLGRVSRLDASAARRTRIVIADVARNLERWVQGIVARAGEQRVLEEMAANANIPVINALSDRPHPCQALADFFTLEENLATCAASCSRRRRRQQRLPLADFPGSASRREPANRDAAELRTCRGGTCGIEARRTRNAKIEPSPIRAKPSPGRKASTPIRGRVWDLRPSRRCVTRCSPLTR